MSLILAKGPGDFQDSFARDILTDLRRKAVSRQEISDQVRQ